MEETEVLGMGARDDARLSEQERAALAGLEAKAEHDDPRLAVRLRGHHARFRPQFHVPPVLVAWLGRLNPLVIGPVLGVLGLAGAVAGVAIGIPLGVAGLLVAVGGWFLFVRAIEARLVARTPSERS